MFLEDEETGGFAAQDNRAGKVDDDVVNVFRLTVIILTKRSDVAVSL